MTGLTMITGPAVEPVSLAELKTHLHIDTDLADDDAQLTALLIAARTLVETQTKRALITQTWKLSLDTVPAEEEPLWEGTKEGADIPRVRRKIELPKPPLQSVTSVVSYDDDDTPTTFLATNYFVDIASTPGRISLRTNASWPVITRVSAGLEITFVAGYGDNWNAVPMPIRTALMELVRWAFDECDGQMPGDGMIPATAYALLQPYMVFRPIGGGLGF